MARKAKSQAPQNLCWDCKFSKPFEAEWNRDLNGNPISGVTVGFCNGEYTPVDTDNNGRVSFDGDPNSYHIHLLAVPNGYSKPWEELHVVGEQLDLIIILNSANDLHT